MSAAPALAPLPGPRASAARSALALGGLTLAEIVAATAIAALAGEAAGSLACAAIALGAAGALRAATAALFVARQRILHRAARTDRESERFVPSPRGVVLAERAPLAIAASAGALAAAIVIVLSGPAMIVGAIALLGLAPAATIARAPIERWIARLPARELPDPTPREVALDIATSSAAPVAGTALLALALAPPGLALLAVPAVALIAIAGLVATESARTAGARRELEALAARLDAIDSAPAPALEPASLRSDAARRAWAEASAEITAATAELRHESDAQRQIEHEEQVRSRFMAAMGHELRSPLNSIVGFAQLLEEGADGPLTPGQRESVVMVRRSAEELLRLLTDILDSARLDAGRLRLKRAWTPSVEIVTEAIRLGRSVVEGHAVRIEAQVQPGLPPVHVDRARIVQAVVATFRHAARGLSEGVLEVRAATGRAPDGAASLLVEVRDAGRTLTEDELARIFDAFSELRDPASGRRIGGLGLALALARKLARLHGGDVWAESRAPDGTRYVVAVPLAGPELEAPPARRGAATSTRGR